MPGIQFAEPGALLALVALLPAVALARRSLAGLDRRRASAALVLRLTILTCLVLALAGLRVVRPVTDQGVVFVLDQSASVAAASRAEAIAFVAEAIEQLAGDDRAGLVVTAREALLERAPEPPTALASIHSTPDPSFTDLAAGLRLAAAVLPADAQPRMVLLSDGNENLGDALGEARRAGGLGIPIIVRPLGQTARGEVTVGRLSVPAELNLGDTFTPRLTVHADTPTSATLRLSADNELVETREVTFQAGDNQVAFAPLTVARERLHRFTAEVTAAGDQEARNNRALAYTFVPGPQRVLYLEGDPGQERYLRDALARSGLAVTSRGPEGLPVDLAELASYDGLILSNISALTVSDEQMLMIRNAVRDLGLGLIMVGGDASFGVGGYYQTPVEDALPVDMDIRKQRHLPNVAVAIVIDQSGSMAMTENGVQKIQLANEAAIAVVELLSDRDQVAVIPTDSVAKPATGPTMVAVEDKPLLVRQIAAIRAGGGGIYCREGLQRAASMITAADAKLKHIILFADAADAEQQEGCVELVADLAERRITTTVVGLGSAQDGDVAFLEQVAKAGRGRFYLTRRATDLPRIFTREAILAGRSQVIEREVIPLLAAGLEPLAGIAELPPLAGYVATTAKPTASVGLVADGSHRDPLLATWHYGLGRAAAFTSDCKARWAVAWVGWPGYDKFWSQLVRWSLRRVQRGDLQARVLSRFEASADEVAEAGLGQGEARVVVDAVAPDGSFRNGLALQATVVTPAGESLALPLPQTAPGRYEASFRPRQVGLYLVQVGGGSAESSTSQTVGFALAYPPEFADTAPRRDLLEGIAAASGGAVVDQPAQVLEPRGRPVRAAADLWRGLLTLALLLFPFDIAVRRLSANPWRLLVEAWRREPAEAEPPAAPAQRERLRAARQRAWTERRSGSPVATGRTPEPTPLTGPAPPTEPTPEPLPEPPATLAGRLRAQRAAQRQPAESPSPAAEPAVPPATPPDPPLPQPAGARRLVPPPADRDVTETLRRLKRARQRRQEGPDRDETDDE